MRLAASLSRLIAFAGGLFLVTGPVVGDPVLITAQQTNPSPGLWDYAFTVTNLQSPTGTALRQVLFDFGNGANPTALSPIPSGWLSSHDAASVDFYSATPGSPPAGSDLAPGQMLETLQLQAGLALDSIPFTAQLFNDNSSVSTPFQGTAIVAGGTLSVSGLMTLTKTSAASTLIITPTGTLQVGTGGALQAGPVINNGILTFSQSGTTVATSISGAGNVIQTSGRTLLTGANPMTGPVNILGGTLQLSNVGAAGLLAAASVFNNSELAFNPTGLLTVTGTVAGPGSVTQIGPGTTTLSGAYSATGAVSLANGELVVAATNAPRQTSAVMLSTSHLSLASNTVFDVTNHDLIIGNSSLVTVESLIKAGFNLDSPAADAPAITSSTASSAGTTFLVPLDADALLGDGSPGSAIGRMFDGTAITQPGTILVKYTYIGDVTLDGKIDGLDYATAAGHLGQTTPGLADIEKSWLMGDVNFDGTVNSQDFALMAANAATSQAAPLGVVSLTPVPEPTTIVLAFLTAMMLLLRRTGHRINPSARRAGLCSSPAMHAT
jgi:autotransporter-associated beta strand protein